MSIIHLTSVMHRFSDRRRQHTRGLKVLNYITNYAASACIVRIVAGFQKESDRAASDSCSDSGSSHSGVSKHSDRQAFKREWGWSQPEIRLQLRLACHAPTGSVKMITKVNNNE